MDEYVDNTGHRISLICISALLVLSLMLCICMCEYGISEVSADEGTELFVLMYHNIIKDTETPNKYEIRVSELESDLAIIRELGIETIVPSDLIAYREGRRALPPRAVMLTFDDGYYSYVTMLLPLLERYDMCALVNVVGEYTRLNKDNPDVCRRYTYVDYDDIACLADSGRVEIGLHSYSYHHNRGAHNGASMSRGESEADYRLRLLDDTNRLQSELNRVGVTSNVYAYPYGAYSRCSDSILGEAGIVCTLSCTEGVNHITHSSSLYLLRRYNRSGTGGSLESLFPFFRA